VKGAGKKEVEDAVARLVAAKKIVAYPAVEGKKKVLVAVGATTRIGRMCGRP
jgi:hypothetical protein